MAAMWQVIEGYFLDRNRLRPVLSFGGSGGHLVRMAIGAA